MNGDRAYVPGYGSGPAEGMGALAIGSAPDRYDGAFGTVVLTAREYQPERSVFAPMQVLRVRLSDSGPPPTREEIADAMVAGREIASRLRSGRRVLVTCWMGLNRSALVSAIALLALGHTADDAIARIRTARGPYALSNKHFVKLLHILARREGERRDLARAAVPWL